MNFQLLPYQLLIFAGAFAIVVGVNLIFNRKD